MTVSDKKIPPYMQILFNKIYENPAICDILDDTRVVQLNNFFATDTLIKDLLRDIPKNAHVLQIGLTFGKEIDAVYNKVQKQGKLDIFDLSETQIRRAAKKYAHHNMTITNYNAAVPWDEKYDVIICYRLLHELPLKTRQQVMDNILSNLTTGGKAIFIDYAKPEGWNLLKYPLKWFNRLYRPFAESLWNEPIENFCLKKDEFRWHHTYYHGHMFQKAVAIRKILSNEDVLKLTRMFNSIENKQNKKRPS